LDAVKKPAPVTVQALEALPVGLFAAVMGITGLGLVWRSTAEVFAIDAFFGDLLIFAGAAVFVVLASAYVTKTLRFRPAVAAEYADSAEAGFFSAIPIGILLISAGWADRWPSFAAIMFWLSVTTMLVLAVLLAGRLFRDPHPYDAANGSWLLGMVSPILAPLAGMQLGYAGTAYFCLSLGFAMWLVLFPVILARMIFGPTVPAGLRPSWFILLVPPMVIFLGYMEVTGSSLDFLSKSLFYLGLFLTVALIWAARDVAQWPFTVAWWAFTFPLDAVAAAAVRYHQLAPSAITEALAIGAIGLATITVGVVSVRTLLALSKGRLLLKQAPAPGSD